jgi:AcrR family transcriptional regulator
MSVAEREHRSGGSASASTGRRSARDRLLAAAAECFYDHGVNGTGIDTITAAAGVAKMSLYNNFASKDDLVLAYLQARHEEWLDLYRRRLATAGDARQRIGAVFGAYIDHAEMAYQHGFRGCGLLNAAAELPAGAPGRQLVRQHKEEVEALLVTHLAKLDDLPPARIADLAEQMSFLLEGAMARAGLEGDSRRLHRAWELAEQLIDAAATSAASVGAAGSAVTGTAR